MSRIYNIIEGQVNNILRMAMEGEEGQVDWDFWSQYIAPKYIRIIVNLLASIIYLMLFSMLGLYLWNQGIHVMAPNVVKATRSKFSTSDLMKCARVGKKKTGKYCSRRRRHNHTRRR